MIENITKKNNRTKRQTGDLYCSKTIHRKLLPANFEKHLSRNVESFSRFFDSNQIGSELLRFLIELICQDIHRIFYGTEKKSTVCQFDRRVGKVYIGGRISLPKDDPFGGSFWSKELFAKFNQFVRHRLCVPYVKREGEFLQRPTDLEFEATKEEKFVKKKNTCTKRLESGLHGTTNEVTTAYCKIKISRSSILCIGASHLSTVARYPSSCIRGVKRLYDLKNNDKSYRPVACFYVYYNHKSLRGSVLRLASPGPGSPLLDGKG
ncbi:hypothetical protein V1477_006518 [Vespula maculifrons]|uniref:Uncharacterized protein n=1 Tax=Vespula maculifrons TaxID=7453 RepID=A0ABD2CJ71_VESMC